MVYETTANLAVMRERRDNPVDFTCADGTAILKGQLLKLTNPRTAIISSAANDMIAGIAARDKVASDGRTQISVYRTGIFDMYLSGSASAGMAAVAAATNTYPNYVAAAIAATSGAVLIGTFLEDGTNGQQVQIYLDCGSGGGLL